MNIYALKGHKVKCENLSAGYDFQKELAEKYLEVGKEYIVEKTKVNDWHTDVWLQEFSGVYFNAVFFEDVVEQDERLNKRHSDYQRFNPEEL